MDAEYDMPRVAFFTFGVLQEEWSHPQIHSYQERVVEVFAAAAQAPGFIKLASAMDDEFVWPRFKRPEREEGAQTLSLWADLVSVQAFSYRGAIHVDAIRRRKEWFVTPRWPKHVAWWVADDHDPPWHEAIERFEHLHSHGSTPYAFSFKEPFDADGKPTRLQVTGR